MGKQYYHTYTPINLLWKQNKRKRNRQLSYEYAVSHGESDKAAFIADAIQHLHK
jgi:hypothetical protein